MATSPRLAHLLPEERAALRSSLADRIDRRVAAFVGGSLAVHVAIAAYAWTVDVPADPPGYVHTTAYHHDIIDVALPDPPDLAPPALTPQPGAAAPAAPRQTARPIVRPTNVKHPASGDDAQRLASILTGANDSAPGTGGMSPRQPGAELGKQIDDARNRTITIGDGTQTSRTDDRARLGTDPRGPLVDDPALTRAPVQRDEQATGRIAIGPVKPDDATTLTPSVVLDRIKALYMAGLQRCYKDGLKLDATLSGRVAISFTVDDRGKVIDASAAGVTRDVDGCIERQMATWRFPVPRDTAGDGTDASFAVSLALQPS